ncbi:MAG: glycosyltransferase family 87 protein [Phycisphaerae bacterium]
MEQKQTTPDPVAMGDVPAAESATCQGLRSYQRTLLGRFDRRVLRHPAARAGLGVLLGAALIVPSIQFVTRIQQTDVSLWRQGGERHKTALGRWLPTAEVLTRGDDDANPYGLRHWIPTTPPVLISLVPLAKLGYLGAGVVWSVLKVGGFLVAMFVFIRSLEREDFALPLGVLVAAGAFSIRPVISDIQHGNLNIFMVIWLALAWAMYVRQRDLWAGLFVALAIVTKLTPALVLVYFVYKRAWRVCLGAGLGLVVLCVVLPGAALGFERALTFWQGWYAMLVRPFAEQGYVTLDIANQSLGGVALRLLSNAGVLDIEEMGATALFSAGMERMARPASALGRLLRPAIAAGVLAALGGLCRSRTASRRDPRLLLEYGLVLLAMLLLSERTWKHHATTLPIVYLGVWMVLTCVDFSDRFRAWFVAGLVVQLFLLVGSTAGLLTDAVAELLLDGGVFCWGLVLCFVQTGVLLVAAHRRLNRSDHIDAQ